MADTQIRHLLARSLVPTDRDQGPELDALLEEVQRRFSRGLVAVLVYGSYIRGKRDTLLDFYILVDDHRAYSRRRDRWSSRLLPPTVFQLKASVEGNPVWAKCAAMTLAQFEKHNAGDFHSYFWARFAQPSRLAFCADEATRDRIVAALAQAVGRFLTRVGPLNKGPVSVNELWSTGFANTYRCEFRAEKASYIAGIVEKDFAYYRDLTSVFAQEGRLEAIPGAPELYRYSVSGMQRRRNQLAWLLRRLQGKVLSVSRLAKAALTFEAPLDYILWKIERHSGVAIEPTEKQRKYPLIFGWGLLWRAYRQGAVR